LEGGRATLNPQLFLKFSLKKNKLGIFSLKTPRAMHVDIFQSEKTNLSNGKATLKIFKTWLGCIANFFTFESRLKKKVKH
jgi:hypothetical protein